MPPLSSVERMRHIPSDGDGAPHHGYLGAGRTTSAHYLERELPAIRSIHDEWMTRLYGADLPAAHVPEYAARVTAVLAAIWPWCLALGIDVIFGSGDGRSVTGCATR